tara:strand:- start:317 stop:544 length:228 start_codon:yes stop_codon:yes gene_type:complete
VVTSGVAAYIIRVMSFLKPICTTDSKNQLVTISYTVSSLFTPDPLAKKTALKIMLDNIKLAALIWSIPEAIPSGL